MQIKSRFDRTPDNRRVVLFATAAVLMLGSVIALCSGCSTKSHTEPQTSGATAGNVTLTSAQRQKIHLYVVVPSTFHNTIESTGTVDFDNDQATSVLAPFSGPVSRLLVSPGQQVKKGDPLAVVDSPDFAAAVSAYRKSRATVSPTTSLFS